MMSDLSWIFAFNVIVNSFLSFLTVYGLVVVVKRLFRIKSPRFVVWLAVVPLLKVIVDICLYRYGQWALAHGINPLNAEPGTRTFSIGFGFWSSIFLPGSGGIGFFIDDHLGFSVGDALALALPSNLMKTIVVSVASITLIRFLHFSYRTERGLRWLTLLLEQAEKYPLPIVSPFLASGISRAQVGLWVSHQTKSPFATGFINKKIVLPKEAVDQWTTAEIEAAIAHELEHLRHYDHYLCYVLKCLETLFWWIPLRGCRRWVVHACEMDCDRAVLTYHMDPTDLAQAIVRVGKSVHLHHAFPSCTLAGCLSVTKRVTTLLAYSERDENKTASVVKVGMIALMALSLLLGRFWLF